jgi:hypothetical protein
MCPWRRAGFLLFCISAAVLAAKPKPCISTGEAAKLLNKDICISAHVYDVVEVASGARFLDVCSPEIPDAQCRFTVASLPQDRETVGELTSYRDKNVKIRGIVQPINGRSGILLSHARQFSGGPPRFTPNPLLARGFDAEQSRPPVSDPNLRGQRGRRAFMNTRIQESLPPAAK